MKREDRALFFQSYIDGSKEYYYQTLGELIDTFGYDNAIKIWQDGYPPVEIDPFCCANEKWKEGDNPDTGIVYREIYDEDKDWYIDYDTYNEIINSYSFDD